MKLILKVLVVLGFLGWNVFCLNPVYAEPQITKITTIAPQSPTDASHFYFTDLLKLVLKDTEAEFGPFELHDFKDPMSPARALEELESGKVIQVYWTGTNIEREKKLIAVKIPLAKGLLGYRVPVIRREDLERWKQIDTLAELQQMRACQVSNWPDSDILEAAKIPVERVSVFKRIYSMLAGKRCDFSPRGINEVFAEVNSIQTEFPDLIAFPDLIIYYPFPLYFFVAPNHPEIAMRLEKGLTHLISTGEFEKFLFNHPVTAQIFPLTKWKNSRLILIKNPLLPKTAEPTNQKLWVIPDQFSQLQSSQ